MKFLRVDVAAEIEQIETELQLASGGSEASAEHLMACAARLGGLRARFKTHRRQFVGHEERLKGLKLQIATLLGSIKEQLLIEVFAIEEDIRPLEARRKAVRSAIQELCICDGSPIVTFEAPGGVGDVVAKRRETLQLPAIRATERNKLDGILQQAPQYWMRASVLQATRLQHLITELDRVDPGFVAKVRSYVHTNVGYTIRLVSSGVVPEDSDDEEESE